MVARKRRIYYREPVFRPPSEAYSLLIQATEVALSNALFASQI